RLAPTPNAFLWIVDITEETKPTPIATYRARPEDQPFDPECWYGCHQAQEQVYDTRLAVTWFGGGLRMVDIANPWRPEELGYYSILKFFSLAIRAVLIFQVLHSIEATHNHGVAFG